MDRMNPVEWLILLAVALMNLTAVRALIQSRRSASVPVDLPGRRAGFAGLAAVIAVCAVLRWNSLPYPLLTFGGMFSAAAICFFVRPGLSAGGYHSPTGLVPWTRIRCFSFETVGGQPRLQLGTRTSVLSLRYDPSDAARLRALLEQAGVAERGAK